MLLARPSVMCSSSRWASSRSWPSRNRPRPMHWTRVAPAGYATEAEQRLQVITPLAWRTSSAVMSCRAGQTLQVTCTGRSQSIPSSGVSVYSMDSGGAVNRQSGHRL
jgi:hypothetical protein